MAQTTTERPWIVRDIRTGKQRLTHAGCIAPMETIEELDASPNGSGIRKCSLCGGAIRYE